MALDAHQFGGFHGQCGKVVAKGLGNHLLRLVQVITRIDQITGSLHRLGATNALQNGSDRIGVLKNVFTGIKPFSGQQWLGKSPGPAQGVGLIRQAMCSRCNHWQH